MECLDELSLGIRGQTMGEDLDHPPVASFGMVDQVAPSLDAPWEAFVHLSPDVR